MLLVIDVGNSDITFGISNSKEIISYGRFATRDFHENAQSEEKLKQEIQNRLPSESVISTILISCVVPFVLTKLKEFCQSYLKVKPFVIGEGAVSFPSQAWVDHPPEVGSDLRVNAYAAHVYYQGPLIVIGFGTATTLSVVNDQGDFCGTVIVPGLQLMIEALSQKVVHLPQVSFQKPLSVLGLNTQDSLKSGLFWGYISLIQGLILKLQQEQTILQNSINKKIASLTRIIATGGYATKIAPHCPLITTIDPYLILKGLVLIYEKTLKER